MSAYSEFYKFVRCLAGDHDAFIHDIEDAQIDAAIETLVRSGQIAGYVIEEGAITPDVKDGRDFALLVHKAAKMFTAQLTPYAAATRSYSERFGSPTEHVWLIFQTCYDLEHGEQIG
jgi:hypothetical protein